jgi:diadenylate cyclase
MDLIRWITPLLEITLIAIALNYLLSLFWNTKSMDLVLGFFAFFLVLGVSSKLYLPILHKLMVLAGNFVVIAGLIIFQPELRTALAKLNLKSRRFREFTEFDLFLDQLANAVYRMSEKHVGALIALEKEDSLREYAQKGVILNAECSCELLESIFTTQTPLHDGAVIIRNRVLVAAAVILPLLDDSSEPARSLGTRHRAGLGLSSSTDAIVIVVSEESGKVSIAREGIMTRGIKIDRFKGILRSIFNPPVAQSREKFRFFLWGRK